ncbi:PIG-L deacetylase family protein [Sphingomonas sp.]|uniref:PIG-L deacetylase family protein n=1 Tax=Sphingomonas sp. TaxID=28214 RepID=UPI003CC6622E
MKLLAVSPHLDDAAFSAGGLLAARAAAGWQVTVATCFTGNVARPTGFALACQLDKGIGPELDYMALRRADDEEACAALGAVPVHLPFLEAPHRGYDSAAALFGQRRHDDDEAERIAPALAGLLHEQAPDLVLAPLCLGDHVDHWIVLAALTAVIGERALLLWEDWPYADRHAPVAAPAALVEPLTPTTRAARLAACAAYRSQLGFQFGGAAALAQRLAAITEERYHSRA